MVRTLPLDADDVKTYNPASWMLAAMATNPEYVFWGPGEDYMTTKEGPYGPGWSTSLEHPTWAEGKFEQDELNEVVHFYFAIARDWETCEHCQNGYNPGAVPGPKFDGSDLTVEELEHLIKDGWIKFPENKMEEVLGSVLNGTFRYSLDSLRTHSVQKLRCKAAGVSLTCPHCEGHSGHHVGETRLEFTFWVLHPRKGASRGVRVKNVKESEMPDVYAYLREARDRSRDRFSKIPETTP